MGPRGVGIVRGFRQMGFTVDRAFAQKTIGSSVRNFHRNNRLANHLATGRLFRSYGSVSDIARDQDSTSTVLRGFSSAKSAEAEPNKDSYKDEDEPAGPVTEKLLALIDGGGVQADPHQLRAASELDRLYRELVAADPIEHQSEGPPQDSGGFFGGLFGGISSNSDNSNADDGITGTRGIYTYGGVGCGKTFLMELFYESLENDPQWSKNRQIVHYHKFMLNVHQFMHNSKQEQRDGEEDRDPIDAVVDHVLSSGRLLCLDEFQVTDVADAMILKTLFGRLWKRGCTLVTTSNRPPRDLYLNGLQRDRFLPFVDLLEERCQVVSLMENDTDYRMVISARDDHVEDEVDVEVPEEMTAASSDSGGEAAAIAIATNSKPTISRRRARQVYFCGRDQTKAFQKLFYERARGRPTNPSTLETQGRKVKIPLACTSKSVCMFAFEDLCQKALGAADYLVIGEHFSTVFVYGVPEMTVHEINWLRRFITFVDSMYEWKVRLLLHTNAGSIEEIFTVDDRDSYQDDEVFAFDRTRSRLGEMSSTQYLASQWLGGDTSSTATATTRLDLEPSLADQWIQLVGGSLSLGEENTNGNGSGNTSKSDTRCRELFDRLDANNDGVLDQSEIKALMTDAFGYEPADLVVNEMIASVDIDQNGVIDLREFRVLLAEIEHHGRNHTTNG